MVGLCRKKAEVQGKAPEVQKNHTPSVTILKRHGTTCGVDWRVLRDASLLLDNGSSKIDANKEASDMRKIEKQNNGSDHGVPSTKSDVAEKDLGNPFEILGDQLEGGKAPTSVGRLPLPPIISWLKSRVLWRGCRILSFR